LNPIGNLWDELKRRVEKRNASNIEELKRHISEEWESTSKELPVKLGESMTRRCQAVVQCKGHKTKY
jgi:hypothetical protein